jgi:organic radical activating enzyme
MVRWGVLQRNFWLKYGLDRLAVSPLINANPIYNYFHRRRAMARTMEYRGRAPEFLFIETHNYCNARCIMCSYANMRRPKGYMDSSLFELIVDEASALGVGTILLHGTSEPLLDPNVLEKIRKVKRSGRRLHVITNGSLLSAEIAEHIVGEGVDEVTVSLDGHTKESYERVRVGLRWEDVVGGIENVIAQKQRHHRSTPFLRLQYVDAANDRRDAYLFWNYWRSRVDEVIYMRANNWAGQVQLDKLTPACPSASPCRFLWTSMVVLWDGTVPLCCLDSSASHVLGRVGDASIGQVWTGTALSQIRDKHLQGERGEVPLCRACAIPSVWWRPVAGKAAKRGIACDAEDASQF